MGERGTYALVLHLGHREEMAIGKLGTFVFPAGYYLYLGSALGPGGLEARLARHRRREKRPRWHIDYLLQRAAPVEVWSVASGERLECLWARAARELPGARIPVPGFGSSDCRCPSHLVHFAAKPSPALFAERAGVPRGHFRVRKLSRSRSEE